MRTRHINRKVVLKKMAGKPIEVYSFFSGAGFFDLGFEEAGFDIVFVNEFNKQFLNVYQYARRNNEKLPQYGYSNEDIRNFLSDENWYSRFPRYNDRANKMIGFIGGPPCPDFSVAGKNEGETGVNGQLTSVYVDLIVCREPDFFVFENVKGLYRTQKHREFYEKLKGRLEKSGYVLFDAVENAIEYGAPQYRERLFLIGFRKKVFGNQIDYKIGSNHKYNLNDINRCSWPSTAPFVENGKLNKPANIIEELTVQYWFEKNDVLNHPNEKDVFKIKNRRKYYNIEEGAVKGKSFKRLHRWRYSPTAAYGNNEVHLHPYLPRRISVAEALAIQSLPEWFELPEELPISKKFKTVGNGVPHLLAYGIADELYKWLVNR